MIFFLIPPDALTLLLRLILRFLNHNLLDSLVMIYELA